MCTHLRRGLWLKVRNEEEREVAGEVSKTGTGGRQCAGLSRESSQQELHYDNTSFDHKEHPNANINSYRLSILIYHKQMCFSVRGRPSVVA